MDAMRRSNQLRRMGTMRQGLGTRLNPSSAQWPDRQTEALALAELAPLVHIAENGVLTVHLAKTARTAPRRIRVRVVWTGCGRDGRYDGVVTEL